MNYEYTAIDRAHDENERALRAMDDDESDDDDRAADDWPVEQEGECFYCDEPDCSQCPNGAY